MKKSIELPFQQDKNSLYWDFLFFLLASTSTQVPLTIVKGFHILLSSNVFELITASTVHENNLDIYGVAMKGQARDERGIQYQRKGNVE